MEEKMKKKLSNAAKKAGEKKSTAKNKVKQIKPLKKKESSPKASKKVKSKKGK